MLKPGGEAPLDRLTFDRLVLQQIPAAQRLAIRLTGRADLAEDIVQDALLKASRSYKTFRQESSLKTWLLSIVIRAFRDDLEKRTRRQTAPLETDPLDHTATDPLHHASKNELGQRIAQAISNLPPRQKEVLILHTYEQLSDDQVAIVLNISPQNVRTTLHLARQRLKEILRPLLGEASYA